jgi:hypothetical protein
MNKETILEFLKELKYSYKDMDKVFLEGSCYRLYKILKVVFPTAQALYSIPEGHWITEIDGNFYDINGELSKFFVEHKKFEKQDVITEASAYIPTYEGQACSYSKYKKSV